MRALSPRERRALRLGGIFLAAYFALFYGIKGWRALEARLVAHAELRLTATRLESDLLREQGKAKRLAALSEKWKLDLGKLKEETAVSEALAAVQKAAPACGLQLGALKELPSRGGGRELATLQLDGSGPAGGLLQLIHSLRGIAQPVALDRLQLQSANLPPGQIRFSISLAVLGFKSFQTTPTTGKTSASETST